MKPTGAKSPLVIVGLDDEWSGNIDPAKAFAGVDPSQPIICLNHNPANVRDLMDFPWQWMLSGHTHGRQVATSKLGQALYPHRYRHYTHGYYSVAAGICTSIAASATANAWRNGAGRRLRCFGWMWPEIRRLCRGTIF